MGFPVDLMNYLEVDHDCFAG